MKRVFISHPFINDPEGNRKRATRILNDLHRQHPDIIFISPLHLFSYMQTETPEQRRAVMALCFDLILICDEVWSYGDTEGCSDEKEFALENKKEFVDKEWEEPQDFIMFGGSIRSGVSMPMREE